MDPGSGVSERVLTSVRGVVRLPPDGSPRLRPFSGVLSAAPVSSGSSSSHSVFAIAALDPERLSRCELSILTLFGTATPLLVARHTFDFSGDPAHGVCKVVWAGTTDVALMSSTGEVLCVPSGLRDSTAQCDSETESETDSDIDPERAAVPLRAAAHALDVCALTLSARPVVLTVGHTHAGAHALRGPAAALSLPAFRTFHAVAAVGNRDTHSKGNNNRHSDGDAYVVGCAAGGATVFAWRVFHDGPVALRTVLCGPAAALAAAARDETAGSRGAVFCALCADTPEEEEEREEDREDGEELVEEPSRPAWNAVCGGARRPPNAIGPIGSIGSIGSMGSMGLRGLRGPIGGCAALCPVLRGGDGAALVVRVRHSEIGPAGIGTSVCRAALGDRGAALALSPALRCGGGKGENEKKEGGGGGGGGEWADLALFDTRGALILRAARDSVEALQSFPLCPPRAVVGVALCAGGGLFVLSGTAQPGAGVVRALVLSAAQWPAAPQPALRAEPGTEPGEGQSQDIARIVREVVRAEGERIIVRVEERLARIEGVVRELQEMQRQLR